MSSELSNALNPYASQSHSRSTIVEYLPPVQPIQQGSHQYVPHRSELELAISEPMPQPISMVESRSVPIRGATVVQELLRTIAATTREAQEREFARRREWEQEQEAKYSRRHAEMEKQICEMQQTILSLKAEVQKSSETVTSTSVHTSGLFTPQSQCDMSPALPEQRVPEPASPISPAVQLNLSSQPMFIQGSSTNPFPVSNSPLSVPVLQEFQHPYIALPHAQAIVESLPQSVTPSPSSQLTVVNTSRDGQSSASSRKKRLNSELSSDDEEGNSSCSSMSTSRPRKRTSHHDRRCLTIHHAIRLHILRLMCLESDKELPDSHKEGVNLSADEPVRFVWDKTTKQSVHNSRMKARILTDIKEKRRLYKHVPAKEFGKKVLDSAFEQSFSTLRQKFKVQRDETSAMNLKRREESKSKRARHLSRRKCKLSNRSDARMNIAAFEHVIFDGALQIECMSSDESDFEQDPVSPRPPGLLCTRGYTWRSSRLVKFYSILDDEDRLDKSEKPKRGLGKKERFTGPAKPGFHLPPQGVASWMISKQWYNLTIKDRPNLPETLKKLVDDSNGFDWENFHDLGNETDSEHETQPIQHGFNPHHHSLSIPEQHYTTSTSSLNYALM
ncbi:hypothetical protein BDQ12DRAFT_731647 [Crucibulum laeve]|uniref:Uncharacterized protein n=1 Tax=Crucibulum laeve TaxID=68775 RepID=A0A5C3MI98_9AGAR|nr:hypothetical protein BDQ12DRAFT_731647 [Crucibulum laeve]